MLNTMLLLLVMASTDAASLGRMHQFMHQLPQALRRPHVAVLSRNFDGKLVPTSVPILLKLRGGDESTGRPPDVQDDIDVESERALHVADILLKMCLVLPKLYEDVVLLRPFGLIIHICMVLVFWSSSRILCDSSLPPLESLSTDSLSGALHRSTLWARRLSKLWAKRLRPNQTKILAAVGVLFMLSSLNNASVLNAAVGMLFPLLPVILSWALSRHQLESLTSSIGREATSITPVTFDDIQGIDEARADVEEVVHMFRKAEIYRRAGAKLPAGLLLAGPPGTGKTMLARVIASQLNAKFLHCSGSEFVEMIVGRGAGRIRSLFKDARRHVPCVVFIDEIDAIGKQRGTTHSEAEQTLNELLTQMDGLDDQSNRDIVVVAATNRVNELDPALKRPGRFDRIISVELPDASGRLAILKVHTKKLHLHPSIDLTTVSEECVGASGAELATLCNEAAIRMVWKEHDTVQQEDFEHAIRKFNRSKTSR